MTNVMGIKQLYYIERIHIMSRTQNWAEYGIGLVLTSEEKIIGISSDYGKIAASLDDLYTVSSSLGKLSPPAFTAVILKL